MGTRKLYVLLDEFMLEHQIKLGRDALFDLLCSNNLLVRRRKRRVFTTNSFHRFRKYPNLIKNLSSTRPNEIWVSDITYWKIENQYLYISLITDLYSHKIVGYSLSDRLEAESTVNALKMAIQNNNIDNSLIHHSDRGIQYCCNDYVKLLQDNTIQISMTEKGDPLENAVAERINGIIKDEYLENYQINSYNEALQLLNTTITIYNNERPHMSIGYNTPQCIHENGLQTDKKWRTYYKRKEEYRQVTI